MRVTAPRYTIDPHGKKGLSRQISDALAADIRTGRLKPGDRLPGERVLAGGFRVCRSTIVDALARLEKQGILEKIPQRGVFVRNRNLPVQIAFPYFSDTLPRREDRTEAGFIFSTGTPAFWRPPMPLARSCATAPRPSAMSITWPAGSGKFPGAISGCSDAEAAGVSRPCVPP